MKLPLRPVRVIGDPQAEPCDLQGERIDVKTRNHLNEISVPVLRAEVTTQQFPEPLERGDQEDAVAATGFDHESLIFWDILDWQVVGDVPSEVVGSAVDAQLVPGFFIDKRIFVNVRKNLDGQVRETDPSPKA